MAKREILKKKWLLVSFQNWKQWWEIICFFQVYLFIPVFTFFALNAAAWSVRGGARLIVCVYFPRKTPKRKRRSEGGKRNWTELFVIPGHGKKRKVLCDVEIFWNEHHPIFFFFPLQIITSVLDWTSTKVKHAFFLAMCLCVHETKCLSKREKANQIGNHCTHTHTERKKKISFLRVLSVDTQSVASTTSSIRRLGKASQRYKSTSSSFP